MILLAKVFKIMFCITQVLETAAVPSVAKEPSIPPTAVAVSNYKCILPFFAFWLMQHCSSRLYMIKKMHIKTYFGGCRPMSQFMRYEDQFKKVPTMVYYIQLFNNI